MWPPPTESFSIRYERRNRQGKTDSKLQSCRKFLYNKEAHTCCKKTVIEWYKSFTYYLVFLAILVFMFMFVIWLLDGKDVKDSPDIRKYQLVRGIGPGFSIFPSEIDRLAYPVLWYVRTGEDAQDNRRTSAYVAEIKAYLRMEEKACENSIRKSIYCGFNKTALGPCGEADYGYDTDQPCVYIKLNQLGEWTPASYKTKPIDVPREMIDVIEERRECLWIHCEGDEEYDKENLGHLDYYPEQAFNEDYFPSNPNTNAMVAVHLKNIKNKSFTYYLVFLAILVFMFMFVIWLLDGKDVKDSPDIRKYQLVRGIGPGFSIFPSEIDRLAYPVLWYVRTGEDAQDNRRTSAYVAEIKAYLRMEEKACENSIRKSIYCGFNKTALGPCGEADYGYDTDQPCVYIKLNQLGEWTPASYKTKPIDVPREMIDVIEERRECLWIHCEGDEEYDKENLGHLDYYPEQAFNEDYFPSNPNTNAMVAVHLKNIKKGHLITMKCRVFADNIIVRKNSVVTVFILIPN